MQSIFSLYLTGIGILVQPTNNTFTICLQSMHDVCLSLLPDYNAPMINSYRMSNPLCNPLIIYLQLTHIQSFSLV